ncbi:uncharacterized protein C8Q71DRAFT_157604 [Rhodofomes roseus]|uniref:N-acetyltransferase domain-containing protein n=1 Tax=Rhodofomes roseus TaxID=34475 RepID=A0ABQ8K9V5_9APHY|nr:uncharacterized protein C8Q71DRAFT_157604 [Rhodofomes roseus]KAH9834044.1 hypothetical protein C8Q71DRAFT_157604 [Rhodofomes roseus]
MSCWRETRRSRILHHMEVYDWYISQLVSPHKNRKATVGWITQLVVEKTYRRRGIATALLQRRIRSRTLASSVLLRRTQPLVLRSQKSRVRYRLRPSSPPLSEYELAAPIGALDLDFVRSRAREILSQTPVSYLRGAELHGSLFGGDHLPGAVCSIFTKFYVDHGEPLGVLQTFNEANN